VERDVIVHPPDVGERHAAWSSLVMVPQPPHMGSLINTMVTIRWRHHEHRSFNVIHIECITFQQTIRHE